MSIEQNLKEVIQRNLSTMAANEVSDYISQAEKDKQDFEKAKNEIIELRDQRSALLAEKVALIQENSKLLEAADNVKELQVELKKRLGELDNEILKIKLKAAEDSAASIYRLVDKVFGHPSVSVSNTSSEFIPPNSSNNFCSYTATNTSNSVSTTGKV